MQEKNKSADLTRLRTRILEISHHGGDGNIQSCFSSIEILYALYHGVMNWSPETAKSAEHDYFILSKGQSSLALSAVLEEKGLFVGEELNTFCKFGSRFSMQLDRTKFPEGGIENSAGSLGHGFPMAVGLANVVKIKDGKNRVYALAGDGEMNEGTMWEACAFAGGHKLDTLTLIIDDNDSIGRMLDLSPLETKLEAFGFLVFEVDGHDVGQLKKVLNECKNTVDKPQAVIAHTVRGYGSKTLMSDNSWFHRSPNAKELEMLKKEVEAFEKSDD